MSDPVILNTRPLAQQEETSQAFILQGFRVIEFPCIEITEIDNPLEAKHKLSLINKDEVIIFTSQHAVSNAYKILPSLEFSSSCHIISVGKKTASVLEQNFAGNIWIPERQNSQGVIDLLKGLKTFKKINLISAAGGRQKIQNFALQNNYDLVQINVYQRQAVIFNKSLSKKIANTKQLKILATSKAILINLKNGVELNIWEELIKKQVICASKRIEEAAIDLGYENTVNFNTANPHLIAGQLMLLETS